MAHAKKKTPGISGICSVDLEGTAKQSYLRTQPNYCVHALRLIRIYTYIRMNRHLRSEQSFCENRKQLALPGHDTSTAEVTPGRAEVSDREVHLIAFPRENRSKERLRKAEERSEQSAQSIPPRTSYIYLLRQDHADRGMRRCGKHDVQLHESR